MSNGETDRQVAGIERAAVEALIRGEHGDPFSILGPHAFAHGLTIRTYLPGALGVELILSLIHI